MNDCTLITVENLGFSVDGHALLTDVSCQFESARIHVLLGQNGTGKSTLLKCLSKELSTTQGQILWSNQPLASISFAQLAQQRGVLSQSIELAFAFTVEQLVTLGVEIRGHDDQANEVVTAVLQACDLLELRHRDYLTLSGGEQKRAQLARVLAQIWPETPINPLSNSQPFLGKWLFLDEWTSGLDIKHQQSLGRALKQWVSQGLGVIMVLHDVAFAAQLADHCVILKSGQVFCDGDVHSSLSPQILREGLEMSARVEQDLETGLPMIVPMLESF